MLTRHHLGFLSGLFISFIRIQGLLFHRNQVSHGVVLGLEFILLKFRCLHSLIPLIFDVKIGFILATFVDILFVDLVEVNANIHIKS